MVLITCSCYYVVVMILRFAKLTIVTLHFIVPKEFVISWIRSELHYFVINLFTENITDLCILYCFSLCVSHRRSCAMCPVQEMSFLVCILHSKINNLLVRSMKNGAFWGDTTFAPATIAPGFISSKM